eukprot:6497452-Prymnesium_polylepis.3
MSDKPGWLFNGWRQARLLPFMALLPAISRALGKLFEWWAIRSEDAQRAAISSFVQFTIRESRLHDPHALPRDE